VETTIENPDLEAAREAWWNRRTRHGMAMKEYRILREIENVRMGPNNHQLLEDKINQLAREGWVVHSFGVSHAASSYGPMFSSSAWFCALLERETKATASR